MFTKPVSLKLAGISYKQRKIRLNAHKGTRQTLGLTKRAYAKFTKQVRELPIPQEQTPEQRLIAEQWEIYKQEYQTLVRAATFKVVVEEASALLLKDDPTGMEHQEHQIKQILDKVAQDYGYGSLRELTNQSEGL